MLMIGVIMGTGVMGLPAAMAKLGWVLGVGSIVVFGLFSAYAALLLSHTRNTHYPQVNSFADLATEVVGPRFGALTRVLIVANWASLLPYYLMAAVSSIESASRAVPALDLDFFGAAVDLPDVHLCYWQWALVLMAVLLIPLQIRTLGSLSGLAAVSDAAVVFALLLMLGTFATMPMPEARALAYANVTAAGDCADSGLWCAVSNAAHVAGTKTSLWPAADATFLDAYGSFSSFIFAFQGHSIFLEVMGQMNPATVAADFRAATIGANLGMGAVYA
jgi:vesicular inhibitory amino acid transporter